MKRAPPTVDERAGVLERIRNEKMARSPHAFVRGNTAQFYERLASLETDRLPHGPPIWYVGTVTWETSAPSPTALDWSGFRSATSI